MIIKGKTAEAVVYADIVEEKAEEQIRRMCDYEFTAGAKIRIMPDVHAGKGCTIGTTMTVTDKVVPNIVGVDIGCGMYTVELAEREIDLGAMDEAAHGIPSGRDVWEEKQESFDLTRFACCHELKEPLRLEKSIGTLGGGNHFIEVDRASDGRLFLVIHSGSRNLGKQVAEYYQSLAIRLNEGWEDTPKKRAELIASYKAAGREREIQKGLAGLKAAKCERTVPDDLCYVYGDALVDYLHDVKLCQDFALRNRERMAKILLSRVGLTAADAFHTIHNYIDTDEMILRKGAIAAHKGERVLIPVNMRDGSILAVGRGNPEWNFSAPHGAGRLMSRIKAKEQLSMEEFREAMAGVYTTSVSPDTLDEAPMAYKSLDDILSFVRDSVDVIDILKPIYNFKAAE
ncbi:MAG: RtcB family protein [Clostridia bacterium]|nr:RtcB family protein [Clostridia bacterium]